YQVEKELGRGAMGIVYQGRDPKINRVVAIKTLSLSEEFGEDELTEVKERFFREAEAAGRLNHPGIVTVYDAGEEHDLAYIAMEFLSGHDLLRYTKPDALLPPEKVINLILRAAEALDYAHAQSIVHRDIKPANLMYDPDKDRRGGGQAKPHVAGAGRRQACGWPLGYLFARRDALPTADCRAAVPGGERHPDHVQDRHRAAPEYSRDASRYQAHRAVGVYRAESRAGEGYRQALPARRADGQGPARLPQEDGRPPRPPVAATAPSRFVGATVLSRFVGARSRRDFAAQGPLLHPE